MKWFIASDIHGSEFYCSKMIELYKKEKADRLLLLGDILYHGPRNDLPYMYNPKAVIEMLNKETNSIICVRGNCDTEVDQMVLNFPILSEYAVICDSDLTLIATHGHVYNKNNTPPIKHGDIVLFGHTHVPEFTVAEGCTFINPGSISIPKENSHHGYMLMENGCFTWKNLEQEIIMQRGCCL